MSRSYDKAAKTMSQTIVAYVKALKKNSILNQKC